MEKLNEAAPILNEVKKGEIIDENKLAFLKSIFNNSLVGTSKLLHFINPEKYAIWDSRVFRFLNNHEAPHKYKLEKPETYLHYLKTIESLQKEKLFPEFYQQMQEKAGNHITQARALELAFFTGGKTSEKS